MLYKQIDVDIVKHPSSIVDLIAWRGRRGFSFEPPLFTSDSGGSNGSREEDFIMITSICEMQQIGDFSFAVKKDKKCRAVVDPCLGGWRERKMSSPMRQVDSRPFSRYATNDIEDLEIKRSAFGAFISSSAKRTESQPGGVKRSRIATEGNEKDAPEDDISEINSIGDTGMWTQELSKCNKSRRVLRDQGNWIWCLFSDSAKRTEVQQCGLKILRTATRGTKEEPSEDET